jgi:hypothetical protein
MVNSRGWCARGGGEVKDDPAIILDRDKVRRQVFFVFVYVVEVNR